MSLLCGLLTGCGPILDHGKVSVDEQKAAIGHGVPLTIDYRVVCLKYLYATLKDPDSAKIIFESKPYGGYILYGDDTHGRIASGGYFVDLLVNAKNSYGGYTGYTPYSFHFRDNRLVAVKSHADWFWLN